MYIGSKYGELCQVSYITRDLEEAMAHAKKEVGVEDFFVTEPTVEVLSFGQKVDLTLRAAIANIGPHQFEIIQPVSGPINVYLDEVDLDRHILNFHHIAFAITGGYENWAKLLDEIHASGDEFGFLAPIEPDPSAQLCFCYVDTRKRVGHYTEFMWWDDALNGMPSVPNIP